VRIERFTARVLCRVSYRVLEYSIDIGSSYRVAQSKLKCTSSLKSIVRRRYEMSTKIMPEILSKNPCQAKLQLATLTFHKINMHKISMPFYLCCFNFRIIELKNSQAFLSLRCLNSSYIRNISTDKNLLFQQSRPSSYRPACRVQTKYRH